MKTVLAACLMVLLLPLSALAGWVEIDSEGNRTFFSEGKVKNTGDAETTWNVFDMRTGELTMVDDARKVYTRARVQDYCRSISAAMDEALQGLSTEERKMMEQMMKSLTGSGAESQKPQVQVESRGSGEKIAGYTTEKYRVLVNGRVYEELWIAPAAPVLEELDVKGVQRYQTEMAACLERMTPLTGETAPEMSPEYEKLMLKGWIMRSIHFDQNGQPLSESTVERLEKRQIPSSEFDVPKGYRKVSVGEFMDTGN